MGAPIRLYVQRGCSFCEDAKSFFKENKVPFETIEIGFDPIILAGIKASSKDGQGLPYPITVSFITQEVRVGFNVADFQHFVDAVNSAKSSDAIA